MIAAEFEFIESSAAGDNAKHSRQRYHAMVSFLDAAIGNVTDAIKAKKGMWENTVMVLFGDNGGWMSANGTAGGNNYPLTGGKYNNWEGGIRLNAFLSGGFLPKASRGTQHHGLVAGWDWYATWCALAGGKSGALCGVVCVCVVVALCSPPPASFSLSLLIPSFRFTPLSFPFYSSRPH